jgi:hypothetical protein
MHFAHLTQERTKKTTFAHPKGQVWVRSQLGQASQVVVSLFPQDLGFLWLGSWFSGGALRSVPTTQMCL